MTNKMLTCKTFALKRNQQRKNVKSQRVLLAVFFIFFLLPPARIFDYGPHVAVPVRKASSSCAKDQWSTGQCCDCVRRPPLRPPAHRSTASPAPTCCMIHWNELRGCANFLALYL